MREYKDAGAIVAEDGKSHGPVTKARLAFHRIHEAALKADVIVNHVTQPPGEGMPLSTYIEHWDNPDNAARGKLNTCHYKA